MTKSLSKAKIDQLGDRLREGPVTEPDLMLLDDYRLSFREAYEFVVTRIRERLGLEATGRPAKSTSSIIEKLRRETIRLSQMQDIAGCRMIVEDLAAQDSTVAAFQAEFKDSTLVDRRKHPSYGYRAVHVIVRHSGKHVEVQVRTILQHLWAEYSEKWSDVVDPSLKYGGGMEKIQASLMRASRIVERHELMEIRVKLRVQEAESDAEILALAQEAAGIRKEIMQMFQDGISSLENG